MSARKGRSLRLTIVDVERLELGASLESWIVIMRAEDHLASRHRLVILSDLTLNLRESELLMDSRLQSFVIHQCRCLIHCLNDPETL